MKPSGLTKAMPPGKKIYYELMIMLNIGIEFVHRIRSTSMVSASESKQRNHSGIREHFVNPEPIFLVSLSVQYRLRATNSLVILEYGVPLHRLLCNGVVAHSLCSSCRFSLINIRQSSSFIISHRSTSITQSRHEGDE